MKVLATKGTKKQEGFREGTFLFLNASDIVLPVVD